MKTFSVSTPRDARRAATLAAQARSEGRTAYFNSGGTDLLGMVKDRIVQPDLLINLRQTGGAGRISSVAGGGLNIPGQITLEALAGDPRIRRDYAVLAEAAETVATPQIRNFGTLAGNICQRPWCWYFRNGFPCYKAGGNQCFSVTGENQFHAIFGGGPSYIVHPSDTAPALVALDAHFRIIAPNGGPTGDRTVAASDFFVLPKQNAARENVLREDEVLVSIQLHAPQLGQRSAYHKEMDREAWTHAVVSAAVVLEMDGDLCRSARIVLGGVAPIPWRVMDAERLLAGQRITPELAARAAEAALAGANPLAKNAYKVPLTKAIIQRTTVELAQRNQPENSRA